MKFNREERRKMSRRLKKTGLSIDAATELLARRVQAAAAEPLSEGEQVRLNYDSIVNMPGYPKRTEAYRAFVEENRDRVFTVAYDDKHTSGRCVLLAEDPTEPKWLWWAGDLIKLEKESVSGSSATESIGLQNEITPAVIPEEGEREDGLDR